MPRGASTIQRLIDNRTPFQFARDIGVTYNYWYYLAKGLRSPSVRVAQRIAEALGLEIGDVIEWSAKLREKAAREGAVGMKIEKGNGRLREVYKKAVEIREKDKEVMGKLKTGRRKKNGKK